MKLKTIGGKKIEIYEKTEVDQQMQKSYKSAGSVLFKDLPVLSEDLIGNVYNIEDEFTTNAYFLEGEGHFYYPGSDVAIVKVDGYLYYNVIGSKDAYDYAEDQEIIDKVDHMYDEQDKLHGN